MSLLPHALTCLLVDDHPAIRQGVRIGIEAGGHADVVGEAGSAEDALGMIRSSCPEVVVVDYQLPGMNGIEFITHVRSEGFDVPVVLLSASSERGLLRRAFAAGANGFVTKESDLDILVAALRAVTSARRYVDPSVAAVLLDAEEELLSRREAEVLETMSVGMQNKEIAFKLDLSEETVKSHVATIMRKLDATSRTQAVAMALRTQLID